MGIDEQMRAEGSPIDVLKKIASSVSIPIAVAGGITSETAPQLLEAGASIIIAGGSIIKNRDVRSAAARLKTAMEERRAIEGAASRKYSADELFEAFSKTSTCNIADAMHKFGVMKNIHPRIAHGTKMVGRAFTVQTAKGDWCKPVEAIDRASPGDVLVIDAGGSDIAVFGELAAWSCRSKGVVGVVIDGAIRDLDGIFAMGFPAFSRHVAPNAGEPKGYGGYGHEIICGEQPVRTGDWIIGDDSGVVVVPQERAVEIANRAVDVAEREERIREEIKRGGTLSRVQELEKWEQIRRSTCIITQVTRTATSPSSRWWTPLSAVAYRTSPSPTTSRPARCIVCRRRSLMNTLKRSRQRPSAILEWRCCRGWR